jgi:flagellar biosynthesis protein FlhF
MQVKRYEVANMEEAFRSIRKDLGPDAVILSSKRLANGKKALYEVVAARDDGRRSEPATAAPDGACRDGRDDGIPPAGGVSMDHLWREVRELKDLVREWGGRGSFRDELRTLGDACNRFMTLLTDGGKNGNAPIRMYHRLTANGVSRPRALSLVENGLDGLPSGEREDFEALMKRLKRRLETAFSGSEGPLPAGRVRALVGPSGSGKTTTIAKLAARLACEGKKKVALVTADTYRLAAAEQLRIYGKILGAPVEVAATREDMERALRKLSSFDVVFVDTPGKSFTDRQAMGDMRELLRVSGEVEKNLVLSLTSHRDHFEDAARTYGEFGLVDKVIVTKLDECRRPGIIYDIAEETGRPISHVACGQNVPRDIQETSCAFLSDLVLHNRLRHAAAG